MIVRYCCCRYQLLSFFAQKISEKNASGPRTTEKTHIHMFPDKTPCSLVRFFVYWFIRLHANPSIYSPFGSAPLGRASQQFNIHLVRAGIVWIIDFQHIPFLLPRWWTRRPRTVNVQPNATGKCFILLFWRVTLISSNGSLWKFNAKILRHCSIFGRGALGGMSMDRASQFVQSKLSKYSNWISEQFFSEYFCPSNSPGTM